MKQNYFLICCAFFVFGCFGNTNAQVKIIETIAGTGTAGFTGDGAGATAAEINANYFLALDNSGNLFFADYNNHRIRKINTSGIIQTVAGNGTPGFNMDGISAITSELYYPEGVAVDGSGNIYIGDYYNNRIRKVTASTGLISTIAGTGTPGYTGDGGPATIATIDSPRGVALDAAGNVYFAEGGNTTKRVRMINVSTNFISTIAGDVTAGYVSDGGIATNTELNAPRGVYVDGAGNVYIADMSNDRIRMVTPGGLIISTVAGNGTAGYLGDGVAATATRINLPTDAKLDASGNMYIADVSNDRIRFVNESTQFISTVAGSGTAGFAGDGDAATAVAVKLNGPVSIAIAPNGNFYISDRTNNRIRIVRNNSTPYFTGGSHQSITVCENSTGDSVNSNLQIVDSDNLQTETYTLNTGAHHGTAGVTAHVFTSNAGTITPYGNYYTPTPGYSGLDTFVVQVSDGYGGSAFSSSLDTIYVTVNPLPVVAGITGPASVCVSAMITLNDVTGTGIWGVSNSNATIGGGTGFVTGVAAGTVTISYTVTNSCGSTSSTDVITVNPLANPGTISGLTSVCTGATIVLTDGAPGGVWSSSSGAASVVGGTVTGVSTGSPTINYSVTNGCGTVVAPYPITVLAIPGPGTITGPSSVCVLSSITLADAAGGGIWSASNATASVAAGDVTGVSAGVDIISYTVSNACGSASATYPVTINPLPDAGSISGPSGVCLSLTITLTDPAGGGAGVWSSPDATVSVGEGTGIVTGISGGTATISYSVTNGCGTAVATDPINIIITPSAGAISGSSSVCQSAAITLTDGVSGGAWSSSNASATVGSGSGVVTGVSGGADTITYSVSYSCGAALTTFTVTINPLPNPGTVSGSSNVCIGASTTYTDLTSGGAWSATNSHATISGTGLATGVSGGIDTMEYSITNGCGTVAASQIVTVNPIVTPAVTITANPGLTSCPGALVTYTATPVYGGPTPAYQWTVNGTVMASLASFVYSPSNGDVVVCKMGSDAACTSVATVTDTVRVVVNPDETPGVSISTGVYGSVVCVSNLVPFTATPVNGGTLPTYQWLVNGVSAGVGNPYNYTPNNGDMISCIITSSYACAVPATALSNTVTMTVNTTETPSVSIIASPGNTVCSGTDVTFTAIPIYGGIAPRFQWTKNSVNVATGPIYNYVPANGDHVYCTLASSATCSTLDSVLSNNIAVTVNPVVIPVVSISVSANYISVGQTTTFTAHVTGTTLPTYQWYVNGIEVTGATASTFILTGTIAGTETITCIAGSTDPCNTSVASAGLIVTVNALGIAQVTSKEGLTLSPNPNNGYFTIEGTLSSNSNEATIEIMDIVGREVYRETVPVQNGAIKESIGFSDEPNGVYLLHVITGDEHKVMRFTVSR